jgi:hypothetical protein
MPRLSKIGAAALAAFGWTSGVGAVSASYLVVAGGAGGSNGGGGAGGYRTGTASLSLTDSYAVTVGAGGAGGQADTTNGRNGSSSVFTTITSAGGGGGGNGSSGGLGLAGGSGGGGGGWDPTSTGGAGNTPSTSPSQGNNGGTGANSGAAGGGGAGAVGSNGATNIGGAGGAGTASSITGSSVTYAGGGGGRGFSTAGAGGAGGGGAGTTGSGIGSAGTANLGGGGGGSGATNAGGNGGSGVVIISYPSPQKFGGGIVTTSGSNTIHTFTTSGTLSPLSTLSASYLIIAGGAGGGYNFGGGGGAGGYLTGSGTTIDTNSTYLVTVGAGGTGSTGSGAGANGGNSIFGIVSTTAVGGGLGASFGSYNASGNSGGSGGGASGGNTGTGGSGTAGQGNNGGPTQNGTAAGGGGSSTAGTNTGAGGIGGPGGNGTSSSITGTAVTRAGGGGGGSNGGSYSTAGTGGAGRGGYLNVAGEAATANTGSGGGGGGSGSGTSGGNGGAGIVVISYAGSTQQMAGGTVTISGGNVIHTFTSSGYLTPLTLVGNSLRFRSSASAYLSRTPTVTSNLQKWTYSAWVKRGSLSGANAAILFSGNYASNPFTWVEFNSSDQLRFAQQGSGGGSEFNLITNAVFRDPAAWYHITIVYDSTNATAANRTIIYVNGIAQSLSTASYPALNQNSYVNSASYGHKIGGGISTNYFDGYITNVNLIDGQALTPNSFGTFNSFGVWQPINYGGSYGTNGFYLPFISNSSTYAGGFNGSNQYLQIAQNAAFNFGTGDFTVECWINGTSWRSDANPIISLGAGAVGGGSPVYSGWSMRYDTVNGLGFYRYDGTETFIKTNYFLNTNQWYHIAISRAGGTLRFFVDGVQVYSIASSLSYSNVNSNPLLIGGNWVIGGGVVTWVTGSISNIRVIAGTGLYTSNFTLPTTNLTAVSGTSLLTLQNATIVDNSTNAFSITNGGTVTTGLTYPFSAAKIFRDQSPQGNNWTPNNISGASGSTLDYMTDVPTLTSATAANTCVLNAVSPLASGSITNGNLTFTSGTADAICVATFGVSSGKWYWEVTATNVNASLSGIGIIGQPPASLTVDLRTPSNGYCYISSGAKGNNNTTSAYGATYASGDIIGVALDMDAGTLAFYKNNSAQGTAYSSLSGVFSPAMGDLAGANSGAVFDCNFGQRPFAYTPPTNFVALNTFNL